MKLLVFLTLMILVPVSLQAQAEVTFAWDASASAATAPADNPVRYRLYRCTDAAYLNCTPTDAGTALELKVTLPAGISYMLARAYCNALSVDGTYSNQMIESGNSNVLKLEVHVPPGNPKNVRVKVLP